MHATHEPTVTAFWSNPPWQHPGGYRLGLSPVGLDQWCPNPIGSPERRRKRDLLVTDLATVCTGDAESLAAQQQVTAWLGAKHPLLDLEPELVKNTDTKNATQLARGALTVPEDLCIMTRQRDEYRLSAACVCAPSYWHLPSKVGLALGGIHAPVPGLNQKIGERINAFMQRLPSDRVFCRRNWFIHNSAELFQPNSETDLENQTNTATNRDIARVRGMVLRSETQTLRRIDSHNILFTILVGCYPMSQMEQYPRAAKAMQQSIATFNADEYEEFGLNEIGEALKAYLAHIVAKGTG